MPQAPGLQTDRLSAAATLPNGEEKTRHWNSALTLTLGIMEGHYSERAIRVPAPCTGNVITKVLSPHDLVISKVARWADLVREDTRALAAASLLDLATLRHRLQHAMATNPISMRRVRMHAEAARELVAIVQGADAGCP